MAETEEEKRKKRIKKLRDKFKYDSDQLVKNEGEWGSNRLARIKENKAITDAVKAYDRKGSKRREQGSKYEAISKAGEEKSKADRARRMELTLGPNWREQTDDGKAIQRVLKEGDARRRALNPENDPEMFSALRNKLNINPTNAEVERRLMARGNARREQARLSEGEAGGALAGSAAERIREVRKVREAEQRDKAFQKKRHEDYQKFRSGKGALEVAREPTTGSSEELMTGAYDEMQKRDARVKDYKGFTDEAALLGQERARRGEGGLIQQGMTGGSLEDLAGEGSAALTEMEEREQRKYGGVGREMLEERHQREKGLMNIGSLPPSERAKLEDPEAAGTKIAQTPSHHDDYIKEIAGDPDAPGLKEWGASVNQESIEGDIEAGMKQDEVERAVNEEFAGEMNQEDAQQAIRDASPEDQKAISQTIADEKGHGPEWVESKEATGNYVSYEGSGLVINMASLGKDIQRNRNMEMLKHIPAANRPAMLVEWGYIDKGDLSTMQKKSAKELKELSLLDLKIAETQGRIEKNKNKMGEKQKLQYTAANKGMQQALKDKDYGLAEVYRNELNTIMPTGDTSNFQELIEKGIKRGKIKTPLKVFKAAGLKDGTKYYDSALSISKSVNFLKTSSGAKRATKLDELLGTTAIDPVTGANKGTYGEFLKNQGIYQWKDVKNADPSQMNIPDWAATSEENYMKWALPQIQNKLMTGIWGNIHQQVQQSNGTQVLKRQEELSQNVTTYDDTEVTSDAQALRGEVPTARPTTPPTAGDPELEAHQKASFKGSSEEAQALIDKKSQGLRDKKIAEGEQTERDEALKQSIKNAGEMQGNFESITQEIAGYDKSELDEALTLQKTRLEKAKFNKRGQPEQDMISQLIRYLEHKIRTKK